MSSSTEPTDVRYAKSPVATIGEGIERRSIDWVPREERHGKVWHQFPLWFLGNFQYFTVAIGFIGPSLGLSLLWTIVAGAAGILIGTAFMAFHATQGPTLGLPQMIQSRAQFGYRGVIVVLFGSLFTYMAFNVSNTALLSSGMQAAFGINAEAVAVGVTVIAIAIAIWGHDWIHRAFRILASISVPVVAILTVGVILGLAHGHAPHSHLGFQLAAFMAQLSAAAAFNISYAPYVSDYSRYLPEHTPAKGIIAAVFAGAAGSAIWLIALGAWLAVRLGATDALLGAKTAGDNVFHPLGTVAAFLLAIALVAVTAMNAYGGMLSVVTGATSLRQFKPNRGWRIVTIVALAVVWYAIGTSISPDAANTTVFSVLTLMLYLLVPWTATNLTDYFVVRRGHYSLADIFDPNGVYGAWNWRGLVAYGVGILVEIPFMVLPNIGGWHFTGPVAKSISDVDLTFIVGFVVTAAFYWAIARSVTAREEARAGASLDAPDAGMERV